MLYELLRKVGPWGVVKAIWSIICMFVTSLLNKTNIMIEYQKECDKTSALLNDEFSKTEDGRLLLAQVKHLHKMN
jgi:hypothetical protein